MKKKNSKTPRKADKKNKTIEKNDGELFNFRRYKKVEGGKKKKARHVKLIVDKTENEFGFMGLTESSKTGHHNNLPLTKNPKRNDNRKAYLRKEVRYDVTENFEEVLKDYHLTKKDKQAIIDFIKKRKKKK